MTQDDQNQTTPQAEQPAQDRKKTLDADAGTEIDTEIDTDLPTAGTDNLEEDLGAAGFPDMDEGMFAQVQEMMGKLGRADELEQENADLKHRLGRLAADFESYRRRTQEDVEAAQGQGVARAAEALMPVYDDLDRALSMATGDPAQLIPGMQAVQNKVLLVFGGLGLEATGREGEVFDPRWHEAIQVVPAEEDDLIVQVYQLGFRMGERSVRPARVVVGRKG